MSRREEENRNPCCTLFGSIAGGAAVGAVGSAVMGNGVPAFYAKVGALAGVGIGLVQCCGDNANLLASLVVSAASWGGSAWLLAPDNNPDLVATAENFGAGFGVLVGSACGLACLGLTGSYFLGSNEDDDEYEAAVVAAAVEAAAAANRGKRDRKKVGGSSAVSTREASVQPKPTDKTTNKTTSSDQVVIEVRDDSGNSPRPGRS